MKAILSATSSTIATQAKILKYSVVLGRNFDVSRCPQDTPKGRFQGLRCGVAWVNLKCVHHHTFRRTTVLGYDIGHPGISLHIVEARVSPILFGQVENFQKWQIRKRDMSVAYVFETLTRLLHRTSTAVENVILIQTGQQFLLEYKLKKNNKIIYTRVCNLSSFSPFTFLILLAFISFLNVARMQKLCKYFIQS